MARLALGWNAPRQPILGMVLSGEVESVGPRVGSFEMGDRVFGFNRHRFGTYAQYVCWPADGLLAPRPLNLTDEEAAAIAYGGLLALHFLRKADVRAGQRVLVYGASGAVGTSAGGFQMSSDAVCQIAFPARLPATDRNAVGGGTRPRTAPAPGTPSPRQSRDHRTIAEPIT